jgi:hypothetical protein
LTEHLIEFHLQDDNSPVLPLKCTSANIRGCSEVCISEGRNDKLHGWSACQLLYLRLPTLYEAIEFREPINESFREKLSISQHTAAKVFSFLRIGGGGFTKFQIQSSILISGTQNVLSDGTRLAYT